MKYFLIQLFAFMFLFLSHARANESFGLTDKTGTYLPAVELLSEDSVWVEFNQLIDKPTILAFVYYHCPDLCTPLLEGLAEVIERSESTLGKEYQVFVVSIDTNETPSMARAKKTEVLNQMNTKSAASHVRFFTANQSNLKLLTDAAGYQFRREGENFIHVAGVILITPLGMISQYLFGTYFMPMHWDMAIAFAKDEKTMPARIKNLKYCYNFVKKENTNVVMLARFFGLTIVILVLGLFIYLVSTSRKRIKHESYG